MRYASVFKLRANDGCQRDGYLSQRSSAAKLPGSLIDKTRIVVGKGQTYHPGAWYDCVPALRIASMVCAVVSNTVVFTALT